MEIGYHMIKDTIDLLKSKDIMKKYNLEEKIYHIYDEIGSGQCSGCGNCCCESVATFYTEFLIIKEYLEKRPDLMEQLLPKIEYYYKNETVKKMDCPFLDHNKRCSIYIVRPHNCRIFGLLTKPHYEESYKKVLENNIKIAVEADAGARELVEFIDKAAVLEVVEVDDALEALKEGKIKALVKIGAGFEENIKNNKPVSIKVQYDEASTESSFAMPTVKAVIDSLSLFISLH